MMAIWLKACIEVLDMLWLVTFSDDCSQSVGGELAPDTADTTAVNVRKRWRRVQELIRRV